jgi:hypothetical protein
MPRRIVRAAPEEEGTTEYHLLDILRHGRVADPAATTLNGVCARPGVGAPRRGHQGREELGPGVDPDRPIADLGDGTLDRRPELVVGQGVGVDDEEAERVPQTRSFTNPTAWCRYSSGSGLPTEVSATMGQKASVEKSGSRRSAGSTPAISVQGSVPEWGLPTHRPSG